MELTTAQAVFAIAVWTAAFLLVYLHASRTGSRHATAWGIAAFLAAGIVIPVYFVRHWLRKRRAESDAEAGK